MKVSTAVDEQTLSSRYCDVEQSESMSLLEFDMQYRHWTVHRNLEPAAGRSELLVQDRESPYIGL